MVRVACCAFAATLALHGAVFGVTAAGSMPDIHFNAFPDERFAAQPHPAADVEPQQEESERREESPDDPSPSERHSVVQQNATLEARKPGEDLEEGQAVAGAPVDEEQPEKENSRRQRSLEMREERRRAMRRNALIVGLAVLAIVGVGYAGLKMAPRSDDLVVRL